MCVSVSVCALSVYTFLCGCRERFTACILCLSTTCSTRVGRRPNHSHLHCMHHKPLRTTSCMHHILHAPHASTHHLLHAPLTACTACRYAPHISTHTTCCCTHMQVVMDALQAAALTLSALPTPQMSSIASFGQRPTLLGCCFTGCASRAPGRTEKEVRLGSV